MDVEGEQNNLEAKESFAWQNKYQNKHETLHF
jgi:hypothetical protein